MALSREDLVREIGELRNGIEGLEAQKSMEALGRELAGAPPRQGTWGAAGGPGDVFIQSKGYRAVASPDTRPQSWSSGPVTVSDTPLALKGTLLESTAGGPGGGVVPPEYQPGIVSKLFEPLGVRDLFGQSQTTGSQIRYTVEGTATSGAAGVAEAGVKPESTIVLSETVEAVRKIATVLPISDEMLEDAPSIQSYLNSRLSLFVAMEEERQLLRGTGTNELVGLFNRSGNQAINTTTRAGADDNVTAIARAIANTAGSANVLPDAVVLHPQNWLNIRLSRAGTAGDYLGGGPITSGGGGLFGQGLWDLPVVLSSTVGAGTALIGAFGTGAHIWRRGGQSVEATNSHADLFVRDITMLRAESRAALGLYRPSAFTALSGLT